MTSEPTSKNRADAFDHELFYCDCDSFFVGSKAKYPTKKDFVEMLRRYEGFLTEESYVRSDECAYGLYEDEYGDIRECYHIASGDEDPFPVWVADKDDDGFLYVVTTPSGGNKEPAAIGYMTSDVECPRCRGRIFKDIWAATDCTVTFTCGNDDCGAIFNVVLPDDIDTDGGTCGCGVVNDEEDDEEEVSE